MIRIKTPFGVRKARTRLKLTRIPGAALPVRPRGSQADYPRTAAVYARLCKRCRKVAQQGETFLVESPARKAA